jgi:hypothetical protein
MADEPVPRALLAIRGGRVGSVMAFRLPEYKNPGLSIRAPSNLFKSPAI